MTATLIPTPQAGVVLKNISWQTYESLPRDGFADVILNHPLK